MPVLPDLAVPHYEEVAIDIDGRAEEAAWEGALLVQGFRTHHPTYGALPQSPTEVRLLSDERALYLHFRCVAEDPAAIRAWYARRDGAWDSDYVGFYLDTSADATRAWFFGVSARGVEMDGVLLTGSGTDMAWDATWSADARLTPEGYEVELRIPWAAVRHPRDTRHLGLSFVRAVPGEGEYSSWPARDPDVNGLLVQEAVVGGPGRLTRHAGLDLMVELPYTVASAPLDDPRLGAYGVHPGLTARYTPGPSSLVLGTFNPDFSEVESDSFRVEVNRRYPVYYGEQRPFFLEGAEWFDHPRGELLYTRTIVSPLYGLRATAEGGGWAAAALQALDLAPPVSSAELGGWTEDDLGQHPALVSAARVRRDVGRDGYVGFVGIDRSILGTTLANRLGGPDARLRLSDTTTVEGTALLSDTIWADRGSGLVPTARLRLSHSADRTYAGADAAYTHPDFRDESGWILVTDRVGGSTWGGLQFRPGWKLVPFYSVQPLSLWASWSTAGELQNRGGSLSAHAGLGSSGGVGAYVQRSGDLYAGEWLERDFWGMSSWADWTRWLAAGGGFSAGEGAWYDAEDPAVGRQPSGWGWLTLRPFDRLSLRQSLSWEGFSLDGETAYDAWVGQTRLQAFLTGDLWGRFVWNWSRQDYLGDLDQEQSVEALVAWELDPGRAAYLGGRVTLPAGSDEAPTWTVSAKVSWLWSL